jgi:hypothetical protein
MLSKQRTFVSIQIQTPFLLKFWHYKTAVIKCVSWFDWIMWKSLWRKLHVSLRFWLGFLMTTKRTWNKCTDFQFKPICHERNGSIKLIYSYQYLKHRSNVSIFSTVTRVLKVLFFFFKPYYQITCPWDLL